MAFSILINGSQGRMGIALAEAATAAGVSIAAAIDKDDSAENYVELADVAVDFSHHDATLPLARLCAKFAKPLVIGTTGHTAEERAAILETVKNLPVVWAGNYSVGITLLNHLVEIAATALDASYQIELVEAHHRHKKDAPSGTAEKLLQILRSARNLPPETLRHGRSGLVGERPNTEIGVHSLRGGDVVGDHTVLFAGEGERVELTHRASNRTIFASGAIRAAIWVAQRNLPAGVYGMEDVLGFSK
ncbi:MAG: 4-hydroxy-tetrahydrodipicolinate reductase [Puniceicoccales bacterium]|jgi:4-hydroxy-tetrahydrodipicolinate reductase|nr:4-hydroxy-tetrahydrodipicolinate reductase [Puniceicoccales bacterium]